MSDEGRPLRFHGVGALRRFRECAAAVSGWAEEPRNLGRQLPDRGGIGPTLKRRDVNAYAEVR